MKKLLFLSILLFNSWNALLYSQEFINKLDSEFCDCISKEVNYTNKTFENCSEKVIPKYQKDLEKYYNVDEAKDNYSKGNADGKDFLKDFMIRLIRNCDSFYLHMEETKKIGVSNFKDEYKNVTYESLASKFKESQLVEDFWEMANWKFANNEYLVAEKMYNEIIKNEPNQMESIYMLALLYDELKQYEKAKILFDKVYEKNPDKIEYKIYSEMDIKKIK